LKDRNAQDEIGDLGYIRYNSRRFLEAVNAELTYSAHPFSIADVLYGGR
jgi:hypothetical protein